MINLHEQEALDYLKRARSTIHPLDQFGNLPILSKMLELEETFIRRMMESGNRPLATITIDETGFPELPSWRVDMAHMLQEDAGKPFPFFKQADLPGRLLTRPPFVEYYGIRVEPTDVREQEFLGVKEEDEAIGSKIFTLNDMEYRLYGKNHRFDSLQIEAECRNNMELYTGISRGYLNLIGFKYVDSIGERPPMMIYTDEGDWQKCWGTLRIMVRGQSLVRRYGKQIRSPGQLGENMYAMYNLSQPHCVEHIPRRSEWIALDDLDGAAAQEFLQLSTVDFLDCEIEKYMIGLYQASHLTHDLNRLNRY